MEIADAVHVVVPPRWSVTVTVPIWPEIVLALVDDTCEPSDTLSVGVLIERAPAVSVNVIGVAADADGADRSTADNAKAALAAPRNFVFITTFLQLGLG